MWGSPLSSRYLVITPLESKNGTGYLPSVRSPRESRPDHTKSFTPAALAWSMTALWSDTCQQQAFNPREDLTHSACLPLSPDPCQSEPRSLSWTAASNSMASASWARNTTIATQSDHVQRQYRHPQRPLGPDLRCQRQPSPPSCSRLSFPTPWTRVVRRCG